MTSSRLTGFAGSGVPGCAQGVPNPFVDKLAETFRTMEHLGASVLEVSAADLYRYFGHTARPGDPCAFCCAAMRAAMMPGDLVLSVPLEENGAALRIRYQLPRPTPRVVAGAALQPDSGYTVEPPAVERSDWKGDTSEVRHSFLQVAELAGVPIRPGDVHVEAFEAPHRRPANLPAGLQAVYSFGLGDRCLKVGKAGPKSAARFCSQHYGMQAPSTLAKSILSHPRRIAGILPPEVPSPAPHADRIGEWMEAHLSRMNILIPSGTGPFALSLLEAFLQCRLKPMFEGAVGS